MLLYIQIRTKTIKYQRRKTMRKENVTIYNESERLDLENTDINFKNSSSYCSLDSGYTNSISIYVSGYCNYDIIKKIIAMKERINKFYSINMYFGDEVQKYEKLTMWTFKYKYDSKNNLFDYEITLCTKTFTPER